MLTTVQICVNLSALLLLFIRERSYKTPNHAVQQRTAMCRYTLYSIAGFSTLVLTSRVHGRLSTAEL